MKIITSHAAARLRRISAAGAKSWKLKTPSEDDYLTHPLLSFADHSQDEYDEDYDHSGFKIFADEGGLKGVGFVAENRVCVMATSEDGSSSDEDFAPLFPTTLKEAVLLANFLKANKEFKLPSNVLVKDFIKKNFASIKLSAK
jgi:hypothetical protein